MSWFDLIAMFLLFVSVSMIPFLFSLKAISQNVNDKFNYVIVSFTAISAAFAGAGILERYDWRFYPLLCFFFGLMVIFTISAKTHFKIANSRND